MKSETDKPETGMPETGAPEAGTPETGAPEAGTPETGTPKAGTPKAGTPKAGKAESGKTGSGKTETEKPPGLFSRFAYVVTVGLFFAVFILLALAPRMLHKVKSGELGVLYRLFSGTDLTRTYGEGLKIIFPLDELYIYDTRVQEFTRAVDVLSFNGLSVHVSLSCRYTLIREELPALHQEVGPEYETKMIMPVLLAAVREVIGTYRPEELYTTHSATIQEEINRVAQEGMTGRHVTFLPILVSSISLPPQVNTAIEDKLRQQQEAQSYEFRLVREAQEKERRRIEGEGINRQLELVGKQLTPPVLKWLQIQAMQALALSQNSKVLVMDSDSKPVLQYPVQFQEGGRAPKASSDSESTAEKKEETSTGELPGKDISLGALETQLIEQASEKKDVEVPAAPSKLRSLLKLDASESTDDAPAGQKN